VHTNDPQRILKLSTRPLDLVHCCSFFKIATYGCLCSFIVAFFNGLETSPVFNGNMFSTTGSVHTLKVFGTCESGGYLSESSYNLIKFRSILPVDKYFYKSCTKSAVTVLYQVSCHCLVPSQLSVSCTKSAVTVLYQVSCHCLVPSQLSLSCTKSAVTVLYQVSCHCIVFLTIWSQGGQLQLEVINCHCHLFCSCSSSLNEFLYLLRCRPQYIIDTNLLYNN